MGNSCAQNDAGPTKDLKQSNVQGSVQKMGIDQNAQVNNQNIQNQLSGQLQPPQSGSLHNSNLVRDFTPEVNDFTSGGNTQFINSSVKIMSSSKHIESKPLSDSTSFSATKNYQEHQQFIQQQQQYQPQLLEQSSALQWNQPQIQLDKQQQYEQKLQQMSQSQQQFWQFPNTEKQREDQPEKENQVEFLKTQITYADQKISYLASIVNQAPILRIRVLTSETLQKGQILTINAQGILDSKRGAKDGITYFGCRKRLERIHKDIKQLEIINDFIIPNQDRETSKKMRGKHFKIEFDTETWNYIIQDLGVGKGVFLAIQAPIILKNQQLFYLGLYTFITVIIETEQNNHTTMDNSQQRTIDFNKINEIQILTLNYNFKNKEGMQSNKKSFDPRNEPKILIGSDPKCNLSFNDEFMSKIQCRIEYTQGGDWIFFDGSIIQGSQEKRSSNGSWLSLLQSEILKSGMRFKTSNTVFEVIQCIQNNVERQNVLYNQLIQ